MNQPVRVALADDQALVRHGLAAVLAKMEGVTVVIDVADGDLLLDALTGNPVDLLILDVRMPRVSGIEVVRRLRAAGDTTPVLLLTTFDDAELFGAAVCAGANGYLLKDAEPRNLEDAIVRLARGETLLAPLTTTALRRAPSIESLSSRLLTEREVDVLRLVAAGYSNKEIGRLLRISDGTVKNHMSDILARLDARDRTHAVLKAIGHGML
jgi:DNA-binding NarL/FixJ family response regulator